jgi:hypothetical protein
MLQLIAKKAYMPKQKVNADEIRIKDIGQVFHQFLASFFAMNSNNDLQLKQKMKCKKSAILLC